MFRVQFFLVIFSMASIGLEACFFFFFFFSFIFFLTVMSFDLLCKRNNNKDGFYCKV